MGDSVDKRLSAADPFIRAQVLNLDRWLIPQQHLEIPRLTFGNQVDPLIHGQTAFLAMHDTFTATGQEDYIYITGWDLVPVIHLLGRTRGAASQLTNVLSSASGRGVDVRLLIWIVTTRFNIPGTNIFMDNKTRGTVGAHHQKTAAVRTSEGLVSFVGGIDLTRDRWDTSAHRYPDPDADYKGRGQPWHDVHARVRGPAAADIETNFRQQWNDSRTPFPAPSPSVPVHPTPAPLPNGRHIVQTLRTFPHHATAAGVAWHYDFAPAGEFGLRQAYFMAIANAQDYIYIEDQYLISDQTTNSIAATIASAMRRSTRLKVILVTAPEPDTPPKDAFDFHQNQFVGRLSAVDPARVEMYHLENAGGTGIYCHSKVCIVDDIWAIIGSCNMSRRSLTHDSEISIAVVDETIERGRRKFARELRKALWAEHLGLTPADPLLDDPVIAAAEWARRAARPPAHPTPPVQVVAHIRPAGSDSLVWNTAVDPDGSTP
jgi:phosphatidylserine/phosphatidylglycerophosphate/cardiolipin synthase-like enzyme